MHILSVSYTYLSAINSNKNERFDCDFYCAEIAFDPIKYHIGETNTYQF